MQKTLGQKIKELRLNNKMTQGELGNGLVTPSMISQIEADKASPSHKLLAELAERLGVTIQYFLEDIQIKMERSGTLKYARMLMEAENHKGASQLLRDLLDDPAPHMQLFEIQMDLAYCLRKLGQTENALNMYEYIAQETLSEGEPAQAVAALLEMGKVEYQRGNLVLADFHWNKSASIGLREVQNDTDLLTEVLLHLAKTQINLGEHSLALGTLEKVRSFRHNTGDVQKIALMSQTFCEVYKDAGDLQKAAEYARDAISMYKNLNLPAQATHMKIKLAQIMEEHGEPQEALDMLEDCLDQADQALIDEISYIYAVMAGVFLRLQKFDKAKAHCEKALATSANDFETLLHTYRTLAEISLAKEQFPEAVYNCEQMIHLSQKQHRIAELTRGFTLLCDIYKKQGDFLAASETFLRMQESIERHLRKTTLTR